jgi:hypothetical protein
MSAEAIRTLILFITLLFFSGFQDAINADPPVPIPFPHPVRMLRAIALWVAFHLNHLSSNT